MNENENTTDAKAMPPASDGSLAWISVTDRLPPVDEKVLYTCFIDGISPSDYFTEVNAGYWDGKARNLPGNLAMKYDDSNDWEPCSHWMPLPAPPNMGSDGPNMGSELGSK